MKGRRKSFSFEPDLSLYPNKVRLVLEYIYKNLGFGKVMTYGEIAKVLNLHPRFVGYALSKNRHLILIPCHRVISKNGLGGFSAGLDIKRFLLSVEGINIFPSLYP
ncbi:MAG: MGMT family protein [candidate division WOR-3 bacterium]